MMKKSLFILAGVIALSFTGCGGKDDTAVNQQDPNTQENQDSEYQSYIDLAKDLSIQMAEGNFTDIYDKFSKELKDQLSELNLKLAWDQTVSSIGDYVGYYDTEVMEKDGAVVVTTILEYEQKGINVLISFNKDDKIDGIWLTYQVISEEAKSNATFSETNIKIGEFELDGMLTLPVGVENPPVVILVHGSGQSDLNETVKDNQPFKDLAYGLAEQGIASIRYNKRFYQFPEKSVSSLTIQDEVLDDVAAAIDYAAECGLVDQKHIIVVGHSLGGMLAPKIASDNSEVAGIVSMAGSPRNLADIIYDQSEDALSQMDITEKQKEDQLAAVKKMVDQIKAVTADDEDVIENIPSAYWYSLNQTVAENIAPNLTLPMLFLQGSADFQVSVEKDYKLWQEILSSKDNCTFKLYDNLNHIFMKTNGKKDLSEYDVKGTVDHTVIKDLADWIHSIQ